MNSASFMDKASRHFRNTIANAYKHAEQHGTNIVTPVHLLFALLGENGSIGEEILRRAGVKREMFVEPLAEIETLPGASAALLSPGAKRAIEKAVSRAAQGNHSYVGTEHLLFGLVDIDSADIDFVLSNKSIKRKDFAQQLDIALKSASKLPEILSQLGGTEAAGSAKQIWKNGNEKQGKQKMPALEFFGVELTNPIFAKKIDPIVGRDSEIERVIHILARRTKNNPILLGDPGVGKTAIVEGLAKRIASGDVPPTLLGRRIFAIDLGLMIAGTMYRGEFESRIKQMVDEVRVNPDIILFIDEIHSIVGAGSSNGTLDAANLLKPALARGELHVIGATTFDEFKKHIEHDAALERRFQPVHVSEPSAEETTQMLGSIKGHYEQFHGIAVGDDAIAAAVSLAHKYFPEKRFPDKAIDLLDEAMSAVKIATANVATAQLKLDLKKTLIEHDAKKQKAVLKEDYDAAQEIKSAEQNLAAQLHALADAEETAGPRATVHATDVYKVVERIVRRPMSADAENVTPEYLRTFLSSKIFGQDDAIERITHAITKAQLGLHEERRPLASFLFVGPTGSGKTELAKLIASDMYHDEKALIRFDMTEFSEGFSVSKMMGSPAGYVGYREGSTIVDRLRRQPMSVLLFDEIDKAHPDVLNILLQMLEEGSIKDASGKEASVKQCVIILTYQIAPEEITGSNFGFGSPAHNRTDDSIRASLFNVIKPELLNRIDQICVFHPVNIAALERIAERQLEDFRARLAKRSITLEWDSDIAKIIAQRAHEPKEGARKIRHVIESEIENPLVSEIAHHASTRALRITTKNDILTIEPIYGGVTQSSEQIFAVTRSQKSTKKLRLASHTSHS
ncbi:MAG: ATP-dependent Clp protease ATP-binding subunit [Candidatus Magasanikbacteria bacterium]|nr:ATP-dependent Clp protease ATP-binding subunit [Candidatus Magasanikbacteria bacterium]